MPRFEQPLDTLKFARPGPLATASINEMIEGTQKELASGFAINHTIGGLNDYQYKTTLAYKIPESELQMADSGITGPIDLPERHAITLQPALDQILGRYKNRQAWEHASWVEKRSFQTQLHDFGAEARSCSLLTEQYLAARIIQDARIKKNDERITPAMVENREQWEEYISRVQDAQERAPIALKWFPLLDAEWEKRNQLLPKFWDIYESDDPGKEKALLSIVWVIVLVLFPRQEFLEGKVNKLDVEYYTAFFENPPPWIEGDIVP